MPGRPEGVALNWRGLMLKTPSIEIISEHGQYAAEEVNGSQARGRGVCGLGNLVMSAWRDFCADA